MSPNRVIVSLIAVAALALPMLAAANAPRPADQAGPAVPGPAPGPGGSPEPASYFTGRLVGASGSQNPEVDLGLITSIRYSANQTNNQGIAIVARKADKTNLCFLQFNPTVMSKTFAGVTRAEAIDTYREVVAAARTPNGRIICMATPSNGPGSIDKALYTGVLYWVVLGNGGDAGFQIVAQ